MKLKIKQAFKILESIYSHDDFIMYCDERISLDILIHQLNDMPASKLKIKYWKNGHCGKLKSGSLFSLVQDRLKSYRI